MSAPGIRLDFSEPISLTSPIAGLVSVRPSVDVRFSIRDSSLFLLGDFELGTRYSVVVAPGVRATSGAMTRERREYPITLEDIKPQIRFSSDGVFLTSGARSRLRFATVNVLLLSGLCMTFRAITVTIALSSVLLLIPTILAT